MSPLDGVDRQQVAFHRCGRASVCKSLWSRANSHPSAAGGRTPVKTLTAKFAAARLLAHQSPGGIGAAGGAILGKFVPQCADADAEHLRGMATVVLGAAQGIDDQAPF